jgi:hypothetical protein
MATFVTTTQPVSITHIGIWDRGGDGLTESHGFRIYDEDNGVDLLNTVFPAASGVLMDKFRYIDVPDIAVPANRNLIVLAHEPNLLGENSDLHTYNLNDVVFDPRFTFRSAAYENGAGINTTFPSSQSSLLAGPNLLFAIPEPASVIIAAVGFMSLGLRTRRRPN